MSSKEWKLNEQQFFSLNHKAIHQRWHPHADKRGRVLEYRLKVEKTIGRYLTKKEVVHHHYNKDGSTSLVLCNNNIYHNLLHIRELALRYCGHANWRKCQYCKEYDDPKHLSIVAYNRVYHKLCKVNYDSKWRQSRSG